jgi:hypothetical protein
MHRVSQIGAWHVQHHWYLYYRPCGQTSGALAKRGAQPSSRKAILNNHIESIDQNMRPPRRSERLR